LTNIDHKTHIIITQKCYGSSALHCIRYDCDL